MNAPRKPGSAFGRFLAEMKRRHVVRFSIGYAAAAFVLLQLAEIVFPAFPGAFGNGEEALRYLVAAIALLYPPAVVLAWVFDITASGIERTEDLPDEDRRPGKLTPRLALLVVTLLVVGGVATWMTSRGVLEDAPTQPRRSRSGRTPELVAYDPAQPIRSLAVLPLENFTESGAQDYFSAGMHEELIAQLSQIAGLRVVSRTSVLRYLGTEETIPRIGQDLQVDALIEGSIRREGDKVRITVQLIHAASDTHIWTHQYDRSLDDVLALQSEVALDIAQQVQAELSPEETTLLQKTASRDVDPEVQDAYLRGKYEAEKGTAEGYRSAMQHFETAVAEDSTFAPALAGLAGMRFLVGMSDTTAPTADEIERARNEAQRALVFDSTSEEARDVLTLIQQAIPRMVVLKDSLAPIGQVGDVAPPRPPMPGAPPATIVVADVDSSWAAAMSQMGRRIEEQVRIHSASSTRESQIARFGAARQLMAAGMFQDAVRMLSNLVDEAPEFGPAWEMIARAQMSLGDPGAAVGAIEGWSARGGDDAPDQASVQALRAAVNRDGASAYWAWLRDRMEARRAEGRPVALTDYAAAQLGSGDTDGALATLQEALDHNERSLVLLRSDPVWDALRSDPRFIEIARQARSAHWPSRSRPAPDTRRR